MKNSYILFAQSIRDLLTRILPDVSKKDNYRFAFLVHPRDFNDVSRKYKVFRSLPQWTVIFFTRYFWPVVLSEVTGLYSNGTGKELKGYIITIPLTARQMLENRVLALRRIIQAVKLAEKKGVKIIGLGALTSSLSKGGLDLIGKTKINITTGHAYTAYNVTQNLFRLVDYFSVDKKTVSVAIVGAVGSVGSMSAQLAVRQGFLNFLLIDQERKRHLFVDLLENLRKINPQVTLEISHQIKDIQKCDFIITATNAPEAIIRSEDLKPGAVVIDDAQPSDVHPEALKRSDVLVIEAGVTHTPNINSHFNFGLKDKHDNFCCMAEVLILAANEWDEHYVINRANLKLVDKISTMGNRLGFRLAEYQNFQEKITLEKLVRMKQIITQNVL
jgi:predicted amino acid dehydrogenase